MLTSGSFAKATPEDVRYLQKWLWHTREARKEQVAPEGDWTTWLFLGGRGTGKTRAGAEDFKLYGLLNPRSYLGIIAPTFAAGRDVCLEGESGLLEVLPIGTMKHYNRSLGEVVLYNGTIYKLYTAEKPRMLRGPQHHRLWGDEVAEWRYPDAWHNAMLGLRLGEHPQAIATGTPKPVPLVRNLYYSQDGVVTRGSTYDNQANLPTSLFREITRQWEGTTLGQQEIMGHLLEEVPGALWARAIIEEHRVGHEDVPAIEEMDQVVVAIDPQGTSTGGGSETGIIVVGKVGEHAYVLDDLSGDYTPDAWAHAAVGAYRMYQADKIVAEKNFGGDMVKHTLRGRDPHAAVRYVSARRGKVLRADPVIAKYEQGKVHHVGVLAHLEDQMSTSTRTETGALDAPMGSDRIDALVYAIAELLVGSNRKAWTTGNYAA